MAEGRRSKYSAPVGVLVAAISRYKFSDGVVMQVFWICRDIVNTRREFHYAETVFKPLVSCSWVDEICQGKLVNFSQPLVRLTVDEFALIRVKPNKAMNRISYFMHRLIWGALEFVVTPPRKDMRRSQCLTSVAILSRRPLLFLTVPIFVPTSCIEVLRVVASALAGLAAKCLITGNKAQQ